MGVPESAYRAEGKTPSDNWGTPNAILEPIYEYYGGIALDPFGDPNSLLVARRYIMLPEKLPPRLPASAPISRGSFDQHRWPPASEGLTFCNGPYSKLDPWVRYGFQESHITKVTFGTMVTESAEVMLLLPVRTSGSAFQRYISRADTLFWNGRLTFQNAPVDKKTGKPMTAPFHSCLAYWGPRPELLRKAFGSKHWIVRGQQ